MTIHNLFADQLQILHDATLGKIDLEKEHPFLSRQCRKITGVFEFVNATEPEYPFLTKQLQLFYKKHSNNDLTLVENLTVDFYHAQPV